ncbi:MAG: anhydro-N-acetylmuramic acid kinase [Firmicutes bacterium]|nr:anhydro-N-acetylmuramic acid kinase [Bacillota bacterium]
MKYIGVMSGTSVDGLDAVLIEDSPNLSVPVKVLGHHYQPWPEKTRTQILALADGDPMTAQSIVALSQAISEEHAFAVLQLLQNTNTAAHQIAAIGMHGQTVWHQPPTGIQLGYTWQLGSPSWVANRTGIPTVGDFRLADMALGGQGAPLVPYAHRLLFRNSDAPIAILNIGGISNVTLLDTDVTVPPVATDLGPGNILIDSLCRLHTQGTQNMDRDGLYAKRGVVIGSLLASLLTDPFFHKPFPKSTGREYFGSQFLSRFDGVNHYDAIATATMLTVQSIVQGIAKIGAPSTVYVAGGGAKNPLMMKQLQEGMSPIRVTTTAELGIPVDQVEAVAFALLGRACLLKIPANIPKATGSSHATILGVLAVPESTPFSAH